MLRTVVVYRSISGFTRKYAEWLAEDLKANLHDARNINAEDFYRYDLIIFGGSLHAIGINGIKLLKENFARLADKKIIVFAVGASPPREGIEDEIIKSNFSDEEQKSLKLFYLRGGFDFGKLDLSNKVLMTLFRVKMSMKRNKTPDEKGMLAAYAKPLDCTKREGIKRIIEYSQTLV